jgi:hypothetical protein
VPYANTPNRNVAPSSSAVDSNDVADDASIFDVIDKRHLIDQAELQRGRKLGQVCCLQNESKLLCWEHCGFRVSFLCNGLRVRLASCGSPNGAASTWL